MKKLIASLIILINGIMLLATTLLLVWFWHKPLPVAIFGSAAILFVDTEITLTTIYALRNN